MLSIEREIDSEIVNAKILRQDLHRHPELGYQEHRTSGVVQEHLKESGIQFVAGLAGGTGVLGYLPSTNPCARTVALRADMDALPIVEATGLDYASETAGKMHACGHDGHTTILLTAARVLARLSSRPNHVLLLFQPAEEGGAGGKRLCEEGALKGKILGNPVDAIYGLHGFPDAEVGHMCTRVGPLMASASELHIHVKGKGSHAAYPHVGIDPIVILSHIVTALQTVASRSIDPLQSVVVTIGRVNAGVAHNVIPETAELHGTLRTFSEEVCALAKGRIETIVTHIAESFGGSATVSWMGSYPVTSNHEGPTRRWFEIAGQAFGSDHVHTLAQPSMGAEDFSFYGQEVPACFFFLGLRPKDQVSYPALHSPYFDFNDSAIAVGVKAMVSLATMA